MRDDDEMEHGLSQLPPFTKKREAAARNAIAESKSQSAGHAGATLLGGGSVLLAAVEAICTSFVLLSKLGILVGFTSFLSAAIVSRYHQDTVRLPVLVIAIVGAAMNLLLLWNWARLRSAPSAAWRKRPLSRRERW